MEVTIQLSALLLQFRHIANVLKLRFSQVVVPGFTTESSKDIASFVIAADFDEPAWRFGEKPDNDEEKEERDDLEGNREAPDEGAVAAT